MEIKITGDMQFGPSWVSIQDMLSSMFQSPDGRLVRISRRDNGTNYRADKGTYDVSYLSKLHNVDIKVVIRVNE